MGDLNELVAWLAERAKPDSGIVYGDNSRGIAEATFHGYDAAFVAERFHGKGAALLAAALTSLIAERDGLREALKPFAEAAEGTDANDDYSSASIWEHSCALDITIGDLRRARRAFSLDTNKGTQP